MAAKNIDIDADWITTLVFGVLLLACSLALAMAVRRFVTGVLPARYTVDFSTYLAAGMGLYGAVSFKDKTLRIVFVLIFAINGAYLVLNWLNVGHEARRLATGGTSMANIFMIAFLWLFLARWFKERIRLKLPLGMTDHK